MQILFFPAQTLNLLQQNKKLEANRDLPTKINLKNDEYFFFTSKFSLASFLHVLPQFSLFFHMSIN